MHSPLVEILESRIAPASVISIANVSAAEGNAGTTDFVFHVTLDQPDNANTITVHYATADGTATAADSDYVAVPDSVVTFAPGDTDKTVTVKVNGDNKHEADETFTVQLTNPTNASIGTDTGTGTIQNDDAVPTISIANVSNAEGNTGNTNFHFAVTLSNPSDSSITVHYATADGTATTTDNDYTAISDTVLTFNPGETSKTITASVNGDTMIEPNETFFVNLTTPINATISNAQGTGTILNDDFTAAISTNKTQFTFTDVDGDLVTVKSSKALFSQAVIQNAFSFQAAQGDSTHFQLQTIDFSQIPGVAKTNLSITAAAANGGDGKVNVGYLNATGLDLGTITIGGDLAKIAVGDAVKTTAITALNVGSIGKLGTTTGAPDLVSTITGPAGTINVTGDMLDAELHVVGSGGFVDNGNIASLKIGGSLTGGNTIDSGFIHFSGTLAKATLGGIHGGTAASTGLILGDYGTLGKIGSIFIGSDGVIGDAGNNSGQISAPQISSITIAGDLVGGTGNGSGVIQSPTIGKVIIHGSIGLKGGAGLHSGEIYSTAITSAVIDHDIQGGTAGTDSSTGFSGVIESSKIGSLTVSGSVIGGTYQDATHTADDSGSIYANEIGTLSIVQNLQGGTGNSSGEILVNDTLKVLKIGGNFTGANSNATMKLINSGYVQAGHLPSVFIGGDMTAGMDGGGGIDTSGAIRSTNEIGTLTIKGNVIGDVTNPAIISAVGQANLASNAKTDLAIKSITIGGMLNRGDILAGYGTDTTNSLLGQPLNADASIGTVSIGTLMIASNIAAGVSTGTDKFFGDANDLKINGAGVNDRPNLISKISSIIIKGQGSGGTGANDAANFGILAEYVVSVKSGGVTIPLIAGASNDIATNNGATNNSKPIGTGPGTGTADLLDFHVAEVV